MAGPPKKQNLIIRSETTQVNENELQLAGGVFTMNTGRNGTAQERVEEVSWGNGIR
jgi:hypothetical protein